MNHTERRILRSIVLAQVGSDGGKRNPWVRDRLPESLKKPGAIAYRTGYDAKEKYLQLALSDIARHKPEGIHFFVIEDVSKKAKYIVYFDIKTTKTRLQVSMHSRSDLAIWAKGCKKSIGKWEFGNSRMNCLELCRLL